MILFLTLLFFSILANAIAELANHGKLKWMSKDRYGFWGEDMDNRKYRRRHNGSPLYATFHAKVNWYTKLFKIKYQERWLTSTNLTVAFTDGYHAMQSASFLFLAGALSAATGLLFFWFWPTIPLVHGLSYKVFSKRVILTGGVWYWFNL